MAEKKRQDELVERQRKSQTAESNGDSGKASSGMEFCRCRRQQGYPDGKTLCGAVEKRVKAENLGLLLWGDVGTGKSFVAACIVNALLEQGIPVLMTNFSKILNQMGAMYSEERYRYIASFFQLFFADSG